MSYWDKTAGWPDSFRFNITRPKVTVLHKEDWDSELDMKGEGSGWGSGLSWSCGFDYGFGDCYGEGQGMGHESGHGFGYGYAMGESWNGTGYVPDCGGSVS